MYRTDLKPLQKWSKILIFVSAAQLSLIFLFSNQLPLYSLRPMKNVGASIHFNFYRKRPKNLILLRFGPSDLKSKSRSSPCPSSPAVPRRRPLPRGRRATSAACAGRASGAQRSSRPTRPATPNRLRHAYVRLVAVRSLSEGGAPMQRNSRPTWPDPSRLLHADVRLQSLAHLRLHHSPCRSRLARRRPPAFTAPA